MNPDLDFSLLDDAMPTLIVVAFAAVVSFVWFAIALSAVFRKAGQNPALAWVPVGNLFTLVRMSGSGTSPWLLLVPVYGLVVMVVTFMGVSQRFGRSAGFGAFGAFFAPIWASIVGWGSAAWLPAQSGAAAGSAPYQWEQPSALGSGASGQHMPRWQPFAEIADHSREENPHVAHRGFGAPIPDHDDTHIRNPAPAVPPLAATRVLGGPAPLTADGAGAMPRVVPPPPPAPSVPPRPPLPTLPDQSGDRAAATASVWGSPGSTRMREDSEVIAEARQAQVVMQSPPPPPVIDEYPSVPIIVPGTTSALSFAVPAPPLPRPEPAPPASHAAAFEDSDWMLNSVSAGIAGVAAPVSATAHAAEPAPPAKDEEASWQPRVRRGNPPAHAPHETSAPDATDTRESHGPRDRDVGVEPVALPSLATENPWEQSAEVSAVVGAPTAGAPRSAGLSVAAQHRDIGVPHEDEGFDHTVVASRRKQRWVLNLPVGTHVALTSDYVILGRKPGDEPEFPSAQLISIADGTRTISKTHAVLALLDGSWTITDLGSTNGVVLLNGDDEEELAPHQPGRLTHRFLLGDAELSIEPARDEL